MPSVMSKFTPVGLHHKTLTAAKKLINIKLGLKRHIQHHPDDDVIRICLNSQRHRKDFITNIAVSD